MKGNACLTGGSKMLNVEVAEQSNRWWEGAEDRELREGKGKDNEEEEEEEEEWRVVKDPTFIMGGERRAN